MKLERIPLFNKVMVIDDNSVDLYITSKIIIKNKFGKEVLEFNSAKDALNYLQINQTNKQAYPDVILSDIYMPLMTGFEFLESYDQLSIELKNHCKLYMLSSSTDNVDIVRVENDINVIGFLEKPITKALLEKIRVSEEMKVEN